MGTTIHAWLKLVIDRMPEPLVNMGTEKAAADRVVERVVPPIAPDTMVSFQIGLSWEWNWAGCRAAIHLSATGTLDLFRISYHDTSSAQLK